MHQKQNLSKNRTVCSNMNIHHTYGTSNILPKLGKIKNLYIKTLQEESEPFGVPVKNVKSRTTDKVSVLHRTNQQALLKWGSSLNFVHAHGNFVNLDYRTFQQK